MSEAIARVAFIGLGRMGLPMAARLIGAGFEVRGADRSDAALAAFSAAGGRVFADAAEAAAGADAAITMLPDGKAVRAVLIEGGVAEALGPGGLVIDMSSSAPMGTRALAEALRPLGVALVDAPVSGGVRRAVDGSLAIMAGGPAEEIERARPLLDAMGKSVFATGGVGSGHAAKALNNYVSASGLAAACEAALIAERFGLDPAVLVDVLNASTGRNNSTEVKMKPFVLSGTFASGFSLALMAKDLRTAADLAAALDLPAEGAKEAARLWSEAEEALEKGADHTEIYRHLAARMKG